MSEPTRVPEDMSDPFAGPFTSCPGFESVESPEALSEVSTFDDLDLKEDLLRGIYAYS
jgi:hypothetical protein